MGWREEATQDAKALLDGLTDAEVHALCVQELRAAYQAGRLPGSQFQTASLGKLLVERVAATKGVTLHAHMGHIGELFVQAITEPWLGSAVEFMSWFERAGFGWAVTPPPHVTLLLTRAGHRFLAGTDDHPLLPAYLTRVASRCPGLPVDVVNLLDDARASLEHQLFRPAIVLAGVAYEVAVEHVVDALIAKNILQPDVAEKAAAARITAVRAKVLQLCPGNSPAEKEARGAVEGAYDFADVLRRRRNEASHTKPHAGFQDGQEVEELLVSAGRHLPALWSLY